MKWEFHFYLFIYELHGKKLYKHQIYNKYIKAMANKEKVYHINTCTRKDLSDYIK